MTGIVRTMSRRFFDAEVRRLKMGRLWENFPSLGFILPSKMSMGRTGDCANLTWETEDGSIRVRYPFVFHGPPGRIIIPFARAISIPIPRSQNFVPTFRIGTGRCHGFPTRRTFVVEGAHDWSDLWAEADHQVPFFLRKNEAAVVMIHDSGCGLDRVRFFRSAMEDDVCLVRAEVVRTPGCIRPAVMTRQISFQIYRCLGDGSDGIGCSTEPIGEVDG